MKKYSIFYVPYALMVFLAAAASLVYVMARDAKPGVVCVLGVVTIYMVIWVYVCFCYATDDKHQEGEK